MSKTLIYAGIGSRQTPPDVLEQMSNIAEQLASKWILRSGHADGADMAFETGAILGNGAMEIFLPWHGFNHAPTDHPDYIRPKATQELANFTAQFHPAWNKCSDPSKLLHMRNSCQVMGLDGNELATMIICWTPKGLRTGGTGQALRVVQAHNIPIFDLGVPGDAIRQQLCEFVAYME